MKSKLHQSFIFNVWIIIFLFYTASTFGQFAPNHVAGLQLWLRSDSAITQSGNMVSQWNDCSGNSHHTTQATPLAQPGYVTNALNGFPGINFNGSSTYLTGNVIDGFDTTSATVFVVATGGPATGDIFRGFFAIGNHQFCVSWETAFQDLSFSGGGTYTYANQQNLPNTGFSPKVISVRKQKGVKVEHIINNTVKFTTPGGAFNGPFTNTFFEIGRTNGNWAGYHKGNIFEVLVYDKYLPDSVSNKVFLYLSQKYSGPAVNLGPDILKTDFCLQTLHAGTNFVHYLWSTGDTTESIDVNQNGSYYVKTTNIFGVISNDTIRVTYPQIGLRDTLFCTFSPVTLSTGLDTTYSYQWSDGQITPSVLVSDTGLYWVTVTKNLCSRISDTIRVSEDNFPTLAWLGNDTNICSGNTIGLVDPTPLPPDLTYNWSTGDTTATIVINSTGDYQLTVSNVNSCVARDTIHVTIGGVAPIVDFSFLNGCSGDSVSFTNNSFPAGDTWQWTFGDGDTSALENPKHVFSSGGTYNVALSVTSGICSNSQTKAVTISESPVAAFSVFMACIGNPYTFFDASLAAPGDSIISWDWDFGDSTAHSSAINPAHTYFSAGNKIVVLNIQTFKGCSGIFSDTIVVVSSALHPTPFTLSLPLSNALVPSQNVSFEWNEPANADKYALEYSSSQNFANNLTRVFPLMSPSYQGSVTLTGNVFWRVIAYNLCGDSSISDVQSFMIMLPDQISGLQLWLHSDSVALAGNKVSQWYDCSGNNHNVVQNNASFQPLYVANQLNQYPAINFNGISTFFTGDTIHGLDTTAASVFILASGEPATGDVFRGFFAIGNHQFCVSWETAFQDLSFSGGGTYTYVNQQNLPSAGFLPKILSVKKQMGVKVEQIINNTLNFTTTGTAFTGPFTNTFFEIGRTSGQYPGNHKGGIFEILIYNEYLPDSTSTDVFKYLTHKYAPPVYLGRDINIAYGLCDTTIDAGSRFTHFIWSTGDTTQTITVSQSGDYSVTATNIFGELSSDSINVSIPTINISDTTFCLGDTINIPSNMGAGYSYLWLPDSVTTNTLSVFAPGIYTLQVTDTIQCYRAKSFTVLADSFAVIASLGPDRKICKDDYIGLVTGAQQAISYLWSDGSGNSLLTINDAYGTNPSYSVTVSNANNCVAHDTIQLIVNGVKPLASFISDSVCFGDTIQFTNQSSVVSPFQIIDYLWDFGDSTFSSAYNPSHFFSHDGYHWVMLTVVTDSGCVGQINKTVKVYSKPIVNFLPYQGCSGAPISFIDKTLCQFGDITQWNWTFNDANNSGYDTSSQQSPYYVFDSAGVYTVKVIAASNAGCVDSVEKTVTIKKSPSLDFSVTAACAERDVYFNDLIDLQPWETIITYDWQFGDGNSSVISNPNHVFLTANIYTTVLTVKTSTGCEVSVAKPIDVGGIPLVDFHYGNNCIFNSTQFSDNSIISNGNITGWHWNFGGLGTSVDKDPVFIFPDTLVYNIVLAVKTDHNCEDSVIIPVKILAAPHAEFSLYPEYGVPPLPVTMLNTSIGATTYLWSFGDNETSTLASPVHTYYNQGIFTVLLSAYNAIGCTDTASAMVYVLPTTVDIMVVNANVNTDNGRMSVTADLLNIGTRKIEHIDMAVDFGNGNILHEQWLGSLLEGEGLHYEFTVSSEVHGDGDVNFVCVQASLPDLTEENTDNNTYCVALKDEFLIPDMYPNPVKDIINIPYILPFEDQVDIEIVNSLGSIIKEIYSGMGKEGYNRILTDISWLTSGVYTVRISFRDKILRKKFVKL